MKKVTTVIKFMKEKDLVDMLVRIRNWKNPNTRKYLRKYRTCDEHWANEWNCAEYKFNMKNLDFVDVLICGEGYVRYSGCSDEVLDMMRERFGFVDE